MEAITPPIQHLEELIHSMQPRLQKEQYVFCTVTEEQLQALASNVKLMFREDEGVTVVLEKADADSNELTYDSLWALITLTVHSDLEAVGFLAAITKALAEGGISVNAVSAYHHDHLFVPFSKAQMAMDVLESVG